jgi:hypothetical protein
MEAIGVTVVNVVQGPPIGPREPMTRQRLIELNRQMQELNQRSRELKFQERTAQRIAFVAAYAAAAIASGGESLVAEKFGVGVAWAYTLAYSVGTSLIESSGDPVAATESTIGAIQTFELHPIAGPAKATTISIFHSLSSPGSVPVGGEFR